MSMYIVFLRSIQSVLHGTALSREAADFIAAQIAKCLDQPGMLERAAARYGTDDPFEIGERAAQEFVQQLQLGNA